MMSAGARREVSERRCPFARGAHESVPNKGSVMLASWSTGRWDLTLEGGHWVRQNKDMTLGGRQVQRDLYESGAQYFNNDRKSRARQAAAGFWVGAAQASRRAAILCLCGTMTEIGGKHASAASMGMGVARKQLESHL